MAKLLVLGAGAMGSAIVAGLLQSGWNAADLLVADVRPEALEAFAGRYPRVEVRPAPAPADALLIAVKPHDLESACRSVPTRGYRRVLSIVAGVGLSRLESYFWPGLPVLRAMPNMPAQIGQGAAALSAGVSANEEDLAWAEDILSCVGVVVRVPEALLDAATGLSGSGPAYVFLVAEALIEAGVYVGLGRELARQLAIQTLLGAARMLDETGEPAESLRAAVTSPGGTTAAALRVLEERAVRAAFIAAVAAATERARVLGSQG